MTDTPVAPAPWRLKCRMWVFVLSPLPKNISFPSGFATSYQADALASGGEFVGKVGTVMLVSYSESPVGPYKELAYIPGKWDFKGGRGGFRITQIYVSSAASVINGRRNWNIPKQVADFKFETQGNGVMSFNVSHPGSSAPFFKATIKNIPILSSLSISFSSAYVEKHAMILQPPLPAGGNPEEIGTDKWAEFSSALKGKSHLVTIAGGFEGGKLGDGSGFPAVQPWSLGAELVDVDMDVRASTFYDTLE